MSEKRFELTKINPTVNLSDTVYFIIDYENPNKEIRTLKDCVGLLNEQQSKINSLKMALGLISNEKLFSRRELERKVDEQQATISQLQDLCGESDGENAKLRIENEQLRRLFEEMKQPITINLTKEDEKELRKLLGLIDDE